MNSNLESVIKQIGDVLTQKDTVKAASNKTV